MHIRDALTFDDVLLEPSSSSVVPSSVSTSTRLTQDITLGIPLLSAAMDTVTESRLAIAMAQLGGLGVIHKNMDIEKQAAEVKAVKKFEAGMVVNPVTIFPDETLADALALMSQYKISGIPVVRRRSGKLAGILTNRDVRFATNKLQPISELMTKKVITVTEGVTASDAQRLLHLHRIEKLVVTDSENKCVGLITVKDMEKADNHPDACKDAQGRLRSAAATGVGDEGVERARALFDAEVDVIVVDTAHGHSENVIDSVSRIRKLSNYSQIIAGNIATTEGAKALIDAGADSVKVGIGPGSICTTRIVTGVGVPQITAVAEVADALRNKDVPLIADGGIRFSGDISKAIAAGGHSVMLGSVLAGTEEAPGEVELYQGRSYKSYRGMGSIGAMSGDQGSKDRYFQDSADANQKLVPEGIEGRVPYKGWMQAVVHQMLGGLRQSMGYTGSKDIETMRTKPKFVQITPAGVSESHVHDVSVTKEAPNYRIS